MGMGGDGGVEGGSEEVSSLLGLQGDGGQEGPAQGRGGPSPGQGVQGDWLVPPPTISW